jgi:N-acetylmuramoyl-L-alanine amidase
MGQNTAGRTAAAALTLAVLACVGAGVSGNASAPLAVAAAPESRARDRFDTVVLDAGHGGDDRGARGARGLLEKDLVLDVSKRLAERLRERGLRVVLTRKDDRFVGLEERTSIANDARGDLFVSIHANAASVRRARGTETFFASLDASDESARELAELENMSFRKDGGRSLTDDPLVAILGDLIATEHLRESQEFARFAQERLAKLELARSRGVKQAPFVVLLGVQMPAALVEVGFLTNDEEEAALGKEAHRDRIADALALAVGKFGTRYDARRGVSGAASRSGG